MDVHKQREATSDTDYLHVLRGLACHLEDDLRQLARQTAICWRDMRGLVNKRGALYGLDQSMLAGVLHVICAGLIIRVRSISEETLSQLLACQLLDILDLVKEDSTDSAPWNKTDQAEFVARTLVATERYANKWHEFLFDLMPVANEGPKLPELRWTSGWVRSDKANEKTDEIISGIMHDIGRSFCSSIDSEIRARTSEVSRLAHGHSLATSGIETTGRWLFWAAIALWPVWLKVGSGRSYLDDIFELSLPSVPAIVATVALLGGVVLFSVFVGLSFPIEKSVIYASPKVLLLGAVLAGIPLIYVANDLIGYLDNWGFSWNSRVILSAVATLLVIAFVRCLGLYLGPIFYRKQEKGRSLVLASIALFAVFAWGKPRDYSYHSEEVRVPVYRYMKYYQGEFNLNAIREALKDAKEDNVDFSSAHILEWGFNAMTSNIACRTTKAKVASIHLGIPSEWLYSEFQRKWDREMFPSAVSEEETVCHEQASSKEFASQVNALAKLIADLHEDGLLH